MAQGKRIQSLDTLRRRVPDAVAAINDDPALALAAAANPILALEELGIALSDRLQLTVAHRARFDVDEAAELERLADDVAEHAGEAVDLRSPESIERLVERLESEPGRAGENGAAKRSSRPKRARAPRAAEPGRRLEERVERLLDRQPAARPLLQYVRLDATAPRLASPEVYARIRSRDLKLPSISVTARLQRDVGDG